MAALLDIAPVRGVLSADRTIVQLKREVAATLRRRPVLVCHWHQDADGRLSCQWDPELPDIPVPPD